MEYKGKNYNNKEDCIEDIIVDIVADNISKLPNTPGRTKGIDSNEPNNEFIFYLVNGYLLNEYRFELDQSYMSTINEVLDAMSDYYRNSIEQDTNNKMFNILSSAKVKDATKKYSKYIQLYSNEEIENVAENNKNFYILSLNRLNHISCSIMCYKNGNSPDLDTSYLVFNVCGRLCLGKLFMHLNGTNIIDTDIQSYNNSSAIKDSIDNGILQDAYNYLVENEDEFIDNICDIIDDFEFKLVNPD